MDFLLCAIDFAVVMAGTINYLDGGVAQMDPRLGRIKSGSKSGEYLAHSNY